jgi:hypothetical protein
MHLGVSSPAGCVCAEDNLFPKLEMGRYKMGSLKLQYVRKTKKKYFTWSLCQVYQTKQAAF